MSASLVSDLKQNQRRPPCRSAIKENCFGKRYVEGQALNALKEFTGQFETVGRGYASKADYKAAVIQSFSVGSRSPLRCFLRNSDAGILMRGR